MAKKLNGFFGGFFSTMYALRTSVFLLFFLAGLGWQRPLVPPGFSPSKSVNFSFAGLAMPWPEFPGVLSPSKSAILSWLVGASPVVPLVLNPYCSLARLCPSCSVLIPILVV